MEKMYYTLEEVGEILGLTVDTIREYRKRKINPLPTYRINRRYWVKKDEFEEWMKRNRDNVQEDGE